MHRLLGVSRGSNRPGNTVRRCVCLLYRHVINDGDGALRPRGCCPGDLGWSDRAVLAWQGFPCQTR
jgi:hypothetical protein